MSTFEGWYYKHQAPANGKALAVIPGRAADKAFVLVISNAGAYSVQYPLSEYRYRNRILKVGENTFSPSGISLNISRPKLTLTGRLKYSNLTPIRGDIMGPFRFFPMECKHGIVSMNHSLSGIVALNGEEHDFTGGKGYIESDRGRSFPSKYTWVQCNDFGPGNKTSIMASAALIPFYGLKFWGCICVVWLNGREYRLATYRGAKILRREPGIIVLEQGKYRLTAAVDKRAGHKLPAPVNGKMSRFIRENIACPARFQFMEGDVCLFDGKSDHAGYEHMDEQ